MYSFQRKLKYIKANLKKWNKESFGNIMEEKLRLESKIGEIQVWVMKDGYNDEESTKEGELIKELAQREKQEEILWRQKYRQMWLKEGDRNTGFFHKATIQNKQQNKISRLKTPIDQIFEKQDEIERNLVQFYSDLLLKMKAMLGADIRAITRHIPRLVTPDHNIMLNRWIE